jgi:ribosome-binding ATPase
VSIGAAEKGFQPERSWERSRKVERLKLGIVGLTGVGKKTVFEALTQNSVEPGHQMESRIGTIRVPDRRVDVLSRMYNPKKTIHAQVEYFLPSAAGQQRDGAKEQIPWAQVRDCDALIHVVRNFTPPGHGLPDPEKEFMALDQELIFADIVTVEKRLERLELDGKRGKKSNPEEISLLSECREKLDAETPLRRFPALASAPILRGYAFLSAKPMLVLFNNEDEDDVLPTAGSLIDNETCMVIKGRLEKELVGMDAVEVKEFLDEFNITASAMDRVIEGSYRLLGLISFFTVGEDEVRAWTIRQGTEATEAAGVIHSDMQKGFIRAEVLSYEDLMDAGSFKEARKKGTVRLEGKTYVVADGDIITFRFNV